MKPTAKRLSAFLSLFTTLACLSGCGGKDSEWEYTKGDMSQFIDIDGRILNKEDAKYNEYYIDGDFKYFEDTISTKDIKVFNYSKLVEDIETGKTDDYLSNDLISKHKAPINEIKVENGGEDIRISFEGNDEDLYGVLLWDSGLTVKAPIISLSSANANGQVQIEFEEKYLESNPPAWDQAKIALNLLGNICSILLGYKDGSASAIGGGVFALLNLLGDTYFGDSGPTLADVLNKLNEISKKIDAIGEKITVNHNQLLSETVRTQAQVDEVLKNQYEANINSFNVDFIQQINDFKRNLTFYVSQRLKEFITGSHSLDLYYSKDSANAWQHHSISESTAGLTKFTINLGDFTNSKAFLASHGDVVCRGFVDEFGKDIAASIAKTSSKPEGLDEVTYRDHIIEQIFESTVKDIFSSNPSEALNIENKVINFVYRIAGKDSESIVKSYVERIKYMFNFAGEGKDMYRSLLSNLLLTLDVNATFASVACRYAAIDQKELGEAYLAARKVIVDSYKNLSGLNDNYCYHTNNKVDGHFYRVKDGAWFTKTGNHPDFSHSIELRKTTYDPIEKKTTFKTEEKLQDHNFVDKADNLRLSTRWKLMLGNGLSDKKTYVEYLVSAGAIRADGYNANKDLVKTGYISKDDKMRVYTGDLSSRGLEDSDKDMKFTCVQKGGPDATNYFEVDKQYNYKGVHDGGCWSGTVYEATYIDGTNGEIDSNFRKVCAYARYDEGHWYWKNDEHWAFIDNPAGNFFYALDYVA